MASNPDVPNKVELTAVTSTPHEHVSLNWNVKNFKAIVLSASPTLDGNAVAVASLPFKLSDIISPWNSTSFHVLEISCSESSWFQGSWVVVDTENTQHEHVALKWNVKNFKALVQSASPTLDGNPILIASLPFKLRATLFPPGTPRVSMYWSLKVKNKGGSKVVRLKLRRKTHKKDLPRNLFTRSSLSIYKDKHFTQVGKVRKSKVLHNHKTLRSWGWEFNLSVLNDCLDSEGSLNLELKADFYVESDGTADSVNAKEESGDHKNEVESLKRRKGIILDQIASLLGDEITSDVIVSIRTAEDVEIGTFFCHSAILAGRSSVLREKLKESTEKKDDKAVLKLEEDVAIKVIDQLVTFICSGRLKDTRKDNTSADPLWVETLPELVLLALKYDVDDLVYFCDLNLYRAAMESTAKAAEILVLAKRLNLKRTLEKLRTEFSKDNELLFQSICP